MHIGYEKANHYNILRFFNKAMTKADMVILDGDIFDLWRTPYRKILFHIKPEFHDVMNVIQATAEKIPVIIIPGNHDFNLEKIWRDHQGYKVKIVNRSLIQGSFLFMHGWQFDVKQLFGSFAYGWLVNQFPFLYQRYFKSPSQVVNRRSDVRSKQVKRIHSKASKYASRHKFKYIVMGHTHVPGIHGNVIDCGDFIDSCSYIEITGGNPELKYL